MATKKKVEENVELQGLALETEVKAPEKAAEHIRLKVTCDSECLVGEAEPRRFRADYFPMEWADYKIGQLNRPQTFTFVTKEHLKSIVVNGAKLLGWEVYKC